MKEPSLKILGAMTGTSCDGIDSACIEISSKGWTLKWNATASYPSALRKRVLAFQKPYSQHSSEAWLKLNRDLGIWYAETLKKEILKHKVRPDVIANHGQTVAHFPEETPGTTLQLGDGALIAAATGLTVVCHFREGDMAIGGQGAPLAPRFHQMIAEMMIHRKSGVAIHNLGGISNVTYLGPKNHILAFDTGPANIWIDAAVESITAGKRKIDTGGRMAREGHPDQKAIQAVLKHPYFKKSPPKSTGRDQFPFDYMTSRTRASGPDLVATATAITISSIAQDYKRWILNAGFPLESIYFCGGGAKNMTLLEGFRSALSPVKILTVSDIGLENQAIEPMAFAVFGYLSLLGKPLGGKWTGAHDFGPPGQIIPGKNWRAVLKKISSSML